MDKLLETGKTPAPITSKIPLNDTELLSIINPIINEQKTEEELTQELGANIGKTVDRHDEWKSARKHESLSEDERKAFVDEKGEVEFLTGYNFNYEHVGDARIDKDNHELQAQRQGNFETVRRGFGRALGEFAINVAETPGVVVGAAAGLVTWDSSKMTENFWVKMTDAAKAELHEELPIYQKKAVTEGGVMDHMLSAAWWASEGASGVAFMGAALIPGLGLAKLPKALSITNKFARWGKSGQKVLKQLDKIARKTGAASKATLKAPTGTAAKQGIDLFNVTMANTVYEAGVEARMAQQAYRDSILSKFESGEIEWDTYEKLYEDSSTVAARTFGMNAALLLGPNLVMSKMLLGKHSLSSSATAKRIKLNKKTNAFEKIKPGLKDLKGLKGRAKAAAIVSNSVKDGIGKKILGVGKTFGSNLLREGVVEEMGQMAIEEFNTKGYIEEQLTGKRSKNLIETYARVLGSTDGQVAALLGGLLGGSMNLVSSSKADSREAIQVENMITSFNEAANKFRVLKQDIYVRDANNKIVLENGEPKIDKLKLAEVGDAKTQIDFFTAVMNEMVEEGDHIGARALAENLQSQVFAPFASEGKAGLDMLKEILESDPATQLALDDHNRIYGTAITKEAYVTLQMDKAKALKEDLFRYQNEYIKVLPNSTMEELGIARWSEEDKEATAARDAFNMIETDRYTQYMAGLRNLKDERANAVRKEKESKERKEGKEQEYKKEIKAIDRLVEELEAGKKELTSEEQVEKRFKAYYKNIQRAAKINSKEVTDYLDKLIKEVKNANTPEEIVKIIAKAKKEGLILPGVEVESLPKELKDMLESDSINEVFAASSILKAAIRRTGAGTMSTEQHKLYVDLFIKAQAQINSIRGKVTLVLDKLIAGASEIDKKRIKLEKEQEDTRYKLSDTISKIKSIIDDVNELETDRVSKKRKRGKEFNAKILELATLEKKARKEEQRLIKSLKETNDELKKLYSSLNSMPDLIASIADKVPLGFFLNWAKKKEGEDRTKLKTQIINQAFLNVTREIDKDTKLGKAPISIKNIMEALQENKNILLGDVENVGDLLLSTEEIDILSNHRNFLRDKVADINNILLQIKKFRSAYLRTKSYEGLAIKEELADIYQALDKEATDLIKEIDKIDDKLNAASKGTLEIGEAARQLEAMLEAIEAIENGEYSPAEVAETIKKIEEEVAEEVTEGDKQATLDINDIEAETTISAPKLSDILDLENPTQPGINRILGLDVADTTAVDFLEFKGILSKHEGAKGRRFLVSKEKALEIVNGVTEKKGQQTSEVEVKKTVKETLEEAPKEEAIEKKEPLEQSIQRIDENIVALATLIKSKHAKKGARTTEEIDSLRANWTRLDQLIDEIYGTQGEAFPVENKEDITNSLTLLKEEIDALESGDVIGIDNNVLDPAVETINSAPGIGQRLIEIVEEKGRALKKENLAALREEAALAGDALLQMEDENNNTFVVGETVAFNTKEGKSTGAIVDIIKSGNNSTNVIIEDATGGIHVINFSRITKADLTAEQYDDQIKEQRYNKFKRAQSKSIVGGNEAVSITIRKRKKTTRRNAETGEIEDTENAFMDYIQGKDHKDPRDKSKDIIHFGVSSGNWFNIDPNFKGLGMGANQPEREADFLAKVKLTREAYDLVKEGAYKNLSEEDLAIALDTLSEFLPISLRVYPVINGKKSKRGAAGAQIGGRGYTGEKNFEQLEKALRLSILKTWVKAGAKITATSDNISNKMEGVEANWSYIREGVRNDSKNVKDNGGTALNELKGHENIDDLNIVAIQGASGSSVYTRTGALENIPLLQEGTKGLVYLETKTLNGEPFYMALEQRELSGTKELDVIMALLDKVMTKGTNINQETIIPDDVLELLPAGLTAAFKEDKGPITYGRVFKTLLSPAAQGSDWRVSLKYANKTLQIGPDVYDLDTFNKNKEDLKSTLGSFKQRVSFIANNKEALTVKNEAYFRYLIEDKILHTNIPAGEPLFTGVKEGDFITGIAPLLSASTVYPVEVVEQIESISEKEVPMSKEVLLSKAAKSQLEVALMEDEDIEGLSNYVKTELNKLYTAKTTMSADFSILEHVDKLKEKEDNTEINCGY